MRRWVILACILPTVCGCAGKGIEIRAGDAREGVHRTPEIQAQGAPRGGRPSLPSAAKSGVWLDDRDWHFRPWVEELQQALERQWEAPEAYRLGLISGSTRLELVVGRDGTLTSLEVLEEAGHPSFTAFSREAVEKIFPVTPLPEDFQGEALTMTLLLDYPPLK